MPPSFPRRLLARVLPPGDRAVILDDLDEEFVTKGAAWYWLQAISSLPGAVRLRWRASRRPRGTARERGRSLAEAARDARFAFRTWRRQPVFAVAAITTQALAIGVSAAIATVAYCILVKPLPYADPARLVHLFEGVRGGQFSYADYQHLRRASRTLTGIAGYSGGSRTLMRPGQTPERIPMAEVSDGFFDTLGVRPAMGRTFSADDVRREAAPVAILAHGAWVRRFAADPGILGTSISLNGQPTTVVGILPESFEFPLRGLAEVWLPLRPSRAQEARGYFHWMDVIARLAPSATREQAGAELAVVAALRQSDDPQWHAEVRYRAVPLQDLVVGPVRPALFALLGAVALLLGTATASITGLLLTRSAARAREFAVRAAIGAGTGRLVRQLITESVLLALSGGILGGVLARWLLQAGVAAIPRQARASLPSVDRLSTAPELVLMTLGLSLVTGVAFGLLPALRWSRHDLSQGLRAGRIATGAPHRRAQGILVAGEVALGFILLSGTGLLARSVHHLLQVSPGFDTHGLLTMRVSLPDGRYGDPASVLSFYDRVTERLAAVPGVSAVAANDQLPLQGRGDTGVVDVEGQAGRRDRETSIRTVSANYFEVLGLDLEAGRPLAATDRAGSPRAVVVNRTFAERVLEGGNPIGRRIRFVFTGADPWEIVGVVGDEQLEELDRGRTPIVYFAMTQGPSHAFSFVIRTTRPDEVAAAARQAVAAVDPQLPLYSVATMDRILESSSAVFFRRVMLTLLGLFAVSAVILASIAVYSLLAQSVSERTREIGVRLALGASRGQVVRLMVASGIAPTTAGLAAGLGASLMTGRALGSLLFGVGPSDPLVLLGAVAAVGSVALAACLVPSLRATRIDPVTTLRQD